MVVQRLGTKIQTWDRGRCGAVSTGKRGAEGQGWASTGSSISPCDAVCSCLISCTRHSGSFPGSGRSGGSRAPFQTQHPLQPGFENQLSLPSFRCLHRAFPSRPERWEHQDVDGKTHPANTRLPEETPHPSRELRSHRRSKKGLTPPCCSPTTIQPRGCHTLQPLKPLFSISYTHPAQAGSEQVWARCGLGGPRQGPRQPGSPGTLPRPSAGSGPEEQGGFLPVSAEFLSVSPQACPQPFGAAAEPVQPVRPTACGERREHTAAREALELVLQTWPLRDVVRATLVLGGRAGSSCLHCPGQEWSRKGAQASLHTASRESHGV